MKEILISNGFKMVSSCSCAGTYAEKYKKTTPKGEFIIEIKPNKKTWSLKKNGVYQLKGTSDNLTEKLYEVI